MRYIIFPTQIGLGVGVKIRSRLVIQPVCCFFRGIPIEDRGAVVRLVSSLSGGAVEVDVDFGLLADFLDAVRELLESPQAIKINELAKELNITS